MKHDIVVDRYFDFASPCAYLQSTQLERLEAMRSSHPARCARAGALNPAAG